MKYASKIILILMVFIFLVIMLLKLMVSRQSEFIDEKETSVNSQLKEPVAKRTGRWSMFHGGRALRGYVQTVLPDSLTVLWKFKVNGEIKSSPVIDEGLVVIGSAEGNIYAIDLENGNQVW